MLESFAGAKLWQPCGLEAQLWGIRVLVYLRSVPSEMRMPCRQVLRRVDTTGLCLAGDEAHATAEREREKTDCQV